MAPFSFSLADLVGLPAESKQGSGRVIGGGELTKQRWIHVRGEGHNFHLLLKEPCRTSSTCPGVVKLRTMSSWPATRETIVPPFLQGGSRKALCAKVLFQFSDLTSLLGL